MKAGIVLVVVVAILSIVLLSNPSLHAAQVYGIKLHHRGGLTPEHIAGWELAQGIAASWDQQTESTKYCAYTCGDECKEFFATVGHAWDDCSERCQYRCDRLIYYMYFSK